MYSIARVRLGILFSVQLFPLEFAFDMIMPVVITTDKKHLD